MHSFLITLLGVIAMLAIIVLLSLWSRGFRRPGVFHLCNLGVATHENAKTYFADAAVSSRYLLGTIGSDAEHIAVADVDESPIGVITDEVATADIAKIPVAVELLGISNRTLTMVASEAVDAGEDAYTAAGGKVQDLPVTAGTYFKVGKFLTSVGAGGGEVEVQHCHPVKLVLT